MAASNGVFYRAEDILEMCVAWKQADSSIYPDFREEEQK